jgi:hypothetical protein
MRNVAQNGFACPMCRTAMAEEPEDEYSVISGDDSVVDSNPNDYALRGFRLFMDNVEGAHHDHEDELEEAEEHRDEQAKPSVSHITQQLTANGVTMEDLVKILLRDHEEYESEDEEHDEVDERVWGHMRTIISNYEEPEPEVIVAVMTPEVVAGVVAEEQLHPNVAVRPKRRRTGIVENLNPLARELDNEFEE